jgi:D-alanyl-D-alanine carboxypeptidase
VGRSRRRVACVSVAGLVALAFGSAATGAVSSGPQAASPLDEALSALVKGPGGAPGVAVVVQRGSATQFDAAGVASTVTGTRPRIDDRMRLASVAKAFSGAAALAMVRDGVLSLGDTVTKWLPELPWAWGNVTLAELLNHTSGIPDFTDAEAFKMALLASLLKAPPPVELLSFAGRRLEFAPGSRYRYSNSDNIVVGLMIEAATHRTYASVLRRAVLAPIGLTQTSLPSGAGIPNPLLHGYLVAPGQQPQDVSELFAAGWSWASGGVVSTPADANRFIRAYVRGATTDTVTHRRQFRFIPDAQSGPPGPGANAAGLAIFRYRTRCGTVYGHTGNTAGYTQFVAATSDGSRSVAVSVNAQIAPAIDARRFSELREIFTLAVCAALTPR